MPNSVSEQRLEELFRRYWAPVMAYARRRVPQDLADDVVAETFTVAWRRLDQVPAEALPWLLGVARQVAATQLRTTRRSNSLRERMKRSGRPGEYDWPQLTGIRVEVAEALARLSVNDREAITLIAWDGLTPAQAARVMGTTAGSFRVRLHRVRRRLERDLRSPSPARGANDRSRCPEGCGKEGFNDA